MIARSSCLDWLTGVASEMPSPQFRLVDFYGCLVGSQRGRAKCHRGITASPPSPSAVVRETSIHHRRLPPPSGSTDGGGGEPRPACCGRWRSCRPRGREHPGPRRRSRPPRLHLRGVETNRAGRRATSSSPSTISRLHHLSHGSTFDFDWLLLGCRDANRDKQIERI